MAKSKSNLKKSSGKSPRRATAPGASPSQGQSAGLPGAHSSFRFWLLTAIALILGWQAVTFFMGGFPNKKFVVLKKISEFTGTESTGEPLGVFGMAIIGPHTLAIADAKNCQILEMDFNGKLIRKWGKRGEKGPLEFNEPSDVVMGPGNRLYVLDSWNGAVKVFTLEGRFIEALDLKKSAAFFGPRQMALRDQNLIINSNDSVVCLSLQGKVVNIIGGKGSAKGRFVGAGGIEVDGKGNLFVGDRGNKRVQEFDKDGIVTGETKTGNAPSVVRMDSTGRLFVATDRGPCSLFSAGGKFEGLLTEETLPETPFPVGSLILTSDDQIIVGLDDRITLYKVSDKK